MSDDPTPLTPNQVVAYNIARRREQLGWTQSALADVLREHTGGTWSKATMSAMERAVDGNRIRHFDADELVLLAAALRMPIEALFAEPGRTEAESDGCRSWSVDEIRALGTRTDLVTACEIVYGCGKNKAWELYHAGELAFPALKVGRRVVCPVLPLMELLEIPDR